MNALDVRTNYTVFCCTIISAKVCIQFNLIIHSETRIDMNTVSKGIICHLRIEKSNAIWKMPSIACFSGVDAIDGAGKSTLGFAENNCLH